jgi:hypothetical protein
MVRSVGEPSTEGLRGSLGPDAHAAASEKAGISWL